MDDDVRIEERDDRAATDLHTAITRVGWAVRPAGQPDDAIRVLRGDHRRLVSAGIVHDDQLPRIPREVTVGDGGQRPGKHMLALVDRHDDRDEGSGRFHDAPASDRTPPRTRRASERSPRR